MLGARAPRSFRDAWSWWWTTSHRSGERCAPAWRPTATRSPRWAPVKKASSASPNRDPDLVLLDLGLPDLDGTDVLRRIRGFSDVPVIVVSVREDQSDKVAALDAGADDYVTKPFGMEELLARGRAAMRRKQPEEPAVPVQTLRRARGRPRDAGWSPATAKRSTSRPPSTACSRRSSRTRASS